MNYRHNIKSTALLWAKHITARYDMTWEWKGEQTGKRARHIWSDRLIVDFPFFIIIICQYTDIAIQYVNSDLNNLPSAKGRHESWYAKKQSVQE